MEIMEIILGIIAGAIVGSGIGLLILNFLNVNKLDNGQLIDESKERQRRIELLSKELDKLLEDSEKK